MAVIMKGAEIAAQIKINVEADINALMARGIKPTLAAIMVGEKPDALSYEKSTIKWMSKLAIACETFHFEESILKADFLAEISKINKMQNIHAMLLFRPIPPELECKELDLAIDPVKDIDGMNPINFGKICGKDDSGHAPCTAEAVMKILKFHNIDPMGKKAVVIGRSMVIGKPVSMLLLNESATVTICHSKTKDLADVCKEADILVASIGRAGFVTKDFIKPGGVVIDVGINVLESGSVVGDVSYEDAVETAGFLTPVPGGVGSVTNAVLAEHIVKAAKMLS